MATDRFCQPVQGHAIPNALLDQQRHIRPAARRHARFFEFNSREVPRIESQHNAPHAVIRDEDIRPQPQHANGYVCFSATMQHDGELFIIFRPNQTIGPPADLKPRQRCQRLVARDDAIRQVGEQVHQKLSKRRPRPWLIQCHPAQPNPPNSW